MREGIYPEFVTIERLSHFQAGKYEGIQVIWCPIDFRDPTGAAVAFPDTPIPANTQFRFL